MYSSRACHGTSSAQANVQAIGVNTNKKLNRFIRFSPIRKVYTETAAQGSVKKKTAARTGGNGPPRPNLAPRDRGVTASRWSEIKLVSAKIRFNLSFDLQFIRHREDSRNTVCAKVSHVAVRFVRHEAPQGDMTLLHDDVNRRDRTEPVSLQRSVSENRPVLLQSDPVVEGGQRQHFDLAVPPGHAFDPLHDVLGVALKRRPSHLAKQRHGSTVDAERKIVKYAEIRQHQQFVPHLVLD